MKMSSGIVVESDGTVTRPKLHDGHLIGVILPSHSCALILVRDVDGMALCIELTGIERFRAEDLREGNIILDLSVETGASVKPQEVAYTYGLAGGSGAGGLPGGIMERCQSGELALVQLDSSYGCSFSCLCSGMNLIPWASVAGRLP